MNNGIIKDLFPRLYSISVHKFHTIIDIGSLGFGTSNGEESSFSGN